MKTVLKIFFTELWRESPTEIHLRKLKNGYLLGNTYVKDEQDLADYLVMALKNPEAELPAPTYSKEKEI